MPWVRVCFLFNNNENRKRENRVVLSQLGCVNDNQVMAGVGGAGVCLRSGWGEFPGGSTPREYYISLEKRSLISLSGSVRIINGVSLSNVVEMCAHVTVFKLYIISFSYVYKNCLIVCYKGFLFSKHNFSCFIFWVWRTVTYKEIKDVYYFYIFNISIMDNIILWY